MFGWRVCQKAGQTADEAQRRQCHYSRRSGFCVPQGVKQFEAFTADWLLTQLYMDRKMRLQALAESPPRAHEYAQVSLVILMKYHATLLVRWNPCLKSYLLAQCFKLPTSCYSSLASGFHCCLKKDRLFFLILGTGSFGEPRNLQQTPPLVQFWTNTLMQQRTLLWEKRTCGIGTLTNSISIFRNFACN